MAKTDSFSYLRIISDASENEIRELANLAISGSLLILGPPGVGKTAMTYDIAQEIARSLGAKETVLVLIRCPQISFADLYVPVPEKKGEAWITQHALSEEIADAFEKAKKGAAGAIVLDDINLAQPEIQPAVNAMTDAGTRSIAGRVIPRNIRVIATGNPEVFGGGALAVYLMDRMATVYYEPDAISWAKRFKDYWGKAGRLSDDVLYPNEDDWRPWREVVAEFIAAHPDMLYSKEPSTADKVSCSPRKWDNLSRALARGKVPRKAETYDVIRDTALAYVPYPKAEAFANFAVYGGLPSPESVLNNIDEFVKDVTQGKYASVFPVIAQGVARYVRNHLADPPGVDQKCIALGESLRKQGAQRHLVVYASAVLDELRNIVGSSNRAVGTSGKEKAEEIIKRLTGMLGEGGKVERIN